MRRPLVKVCGITNYDDAHVCLKFGANMLGFIFYEESPRSVNPMNVREIVSALKGKFPFDSVAVFVNPTREYVDYIIEISGIDILQFHGDESPAFIKGIDKKRKIKAFRIKDKSDILRCHEYRDIDYFLFDAFSAKSYGGTGMAFDWDLLKNFMYREKLILSGGINSDNVVAAIKMISPYALDLSSSLEKEPGRKDSKKVREFFLKLGNIQNYSI